MSKTVQKCCGLVFLTGGKVYGRNERKQGQNPL